MQLAIHSWQTHISSTAVNNRNNFCRVSLSVIFPRSILYRKRWDFCMHRTATAHAGHSKGTKFWSEVHLQHELETKKKIHCYASETYFRDPEKTRQKFFTTHGTTESCCIAKQDWWTWSPLLRLTQCTVTCYVKCPRHCNMLVSWALKRTSSHSSCKLLACSTLQKFTPAKHAQVLPEQESSPPSEACTSTNV